MTLADFVQAVVLYAWLTDASATSWGRTRAHNARVGGVAKSPHRFWLAVDLVYDSGIPPADGVELAARLGLKLIREGDHDHLQPIGWLP